MKPTATRAIAAARRLIVSGRSAIAAIASSSAVSGPSFRPLVPQKTAVGYRAASHAARTARRRPPRASPMAAAAGTDSADSSAATTFSTTQWWPNT